MTKQMIFSSLSGLLLLWLPLPAQTPNMADKSFMKMAAQMDMTEAHIGQMAANQAADSRVKDFAQKLTNDHTDAYRQLTNLAAKAGDSVPNGINVGKISEVEQLTKLKGSQFDHAFIEDEIHDHQRALASFKGEAQHGHDPDVKAYAAKMVPVLESHLHDAESLAPRNTASTKRH